MHQGIVKDQGTVEIGMIALGAVETPALDPVPEIYLVRDLGIEEIASRTTSLDLEIDLGRGKGIPEPQVQATDIE